MGIFVSVVRHNYDLKTVTENKIQINVSQYKIGEYSWDITKYDSSMCGVLQVFPMFKVQKIYEFIHGAPQITYEDPKSDITWQLS